MKSPGRPRAPIDLRAPAASVDIFSLAGGIEGFRGRIDVARPDQGRLLVSPLHQVLEPLDRAQEDDERSRGPGGPQWPKDAGAPSAPDDRHHDRHHDRHNQHSGPRGDRLRVAADAIGLDAACR